ncbi:MAG: hypothetical protein L0332_26385 [Chloroflexi bacterium]|nr:hypothetical protein [Chloroflexota bacterium]MCI0577724.1 hypothetical protein [Chloroflexota bacterium]MCI0643322.1 hypothetical protein [Chloroflexota bacterium]MCI0730225.1 hypothetical protein [Chloroflexota bacterium]
MKSLATDGQVVDTRVVFEETPARLKVVIPDKTNWLLFGLYSLALLVWLGMFVVVLRFLFQGPGNAVLAILLFLWSLIWLWFGRFLWGRWQYYAANREILFIDREQLILRRPVSILGLTTSYDRRHAGPFYYSDKHHCPAFDYAYQHVYFGHSLPAAEAQQLVKTLNARYFPDEEDE